MTSFFSSAMSRTRLRKNVLPAPYSPMMKRIARRIAGYPVDVSKRAATSAARPTWKCRRPLPRNDARGERLNDRITFASANREGVPFISLCPSSP